MKNKIEKQSLQGVGRRDFIKHTGAGVLALMLPRATWGQSSGSAGPESLLLEAEQFAEKGGWLVDSQFFDELGFSYLLAHGLGEPVENARTQAEFPEEGEYYLWVRTKNWVSGGEWEPPGRFQLLIEGEPVEATFGTKAGWGWQAAGPVRIPNRQVRIELHDLTGFDGRCDAIYFSKNRNDEPPNEREALTRWRREKHGIPETPEWQEAFDVVIVGGGLSGCAAALAANMKGMKVALVQDRPVFGGNASAEVRVHTLGILGQRGDIISQIDTAHYPNGSPDAKKEDERRHAAIDAAENVHQFLGHSVYAAHTEGSRITSVDALEIEAGVARRFTAPIFIDCTGDGWLGFWAGASYRYGRESRHEFDEGWDRYDELWSPEEPDNEILGTSVLWRSYEADQPSRFPEVPWAMPVAKDHEAVQGEWYWEYSDNEIHQIDDAERVRDHMFRAIYGSFANAKRHPRHARQKLEWVAHVAGKRESRRLMGDYIFTQADALEGEKFIDAVVTEERAVDLHFQRKHTGHQVDFLAQAMFRRPGGRYYLPFRCLYSRDVENLMMAGRCFSCSHVGLGGPRVMRTCGQMGVAVGFAASLCVKHDTTPRGIYNNHLRELRELTGYLKVWRTSDENYGYAELPEDLTHLHRVTIMRGDFREPAPGFTFRVDRPVTVYLAVHDRGNWRPSASWRETAMSGLWDQHSDKIYQRDFPAGTVEIPPHEGLDGEYFGLPHVAFIKVRQGDQPNLAISDLPETLNGSATSP